jgi:transcriptional regulator with GAF, ATPase, and Fis domain
MLLLWDTIAVISSAEDENQIAADFVDRIDLSLSPRVSALILGSGDDAEVLASTNRSTRIGDEYNVLGDEQQPLLLQVEETRTTEHLSLPPLVEGEKQRVAYAAPLLAGERFLGYLYVEGPDPDFLLDSSDVIFLNALAGQVAIALDRVHLAARWREETERESRRLREEVHELRQFVHSARLVYRSPQMTDLLETARTAAVTDVTILITGESGTGKEVLARAVHEMSERKDKPLITVDCGAIAHNLIEAELFGHIKGAYTGADRAAEGRIVQAAGGTLFLDEIGEVPLDVQAKLLRFVQEKEFTPLGATQSQTVDVRIIAATNRDLAAEAAAGRFREDLFYRLNVVTLTPPALRERPDDIMPLATHFLEKFSVQYEKGQRRFSSDAERLIAEHRWPGNVRELQNSILRAVVLSNSEIIDADLLLHRPSADPSSPVAPGSREPADPNPEISGSELPSSSPPPVPPAPPESDDPWHVLRLGLIAQVDDALDQGAQIPVGRWLNEDLVLAMDEMVRGVARRGATQLGLAATTYRRQLEKIRRAEAQGLLARSPNWTTMRTLISRLVESLPETAEENLVEATRDMLLQEVNSRVSGNESKGSALMGVTVPTYRRWCERSAP